MKKQNILLSSYIATMQSGAAHSFLFLVININKSNYFHPIVLLGEHGELYDKLIQNRIETYVIPQHEKWYERIDGYEDIEKEKYSSFFRVMKDIARPIVCWYERKKIRHLLINRNIALVHINTLTHGMCAEVAENLGIPVVWHIREFMEEDLHIKLANPKKVISLVNQAKTIIAISCGIKDKYDKIFTAPIEVIYNGIHYEKKQESKKAVKDKLFHIAIIGRIVESKGQLELVKAICKLNKMSQKKCLVHIWGNIEDEEYFEQINDYINLYNLNDIVKYEGFLNNILVNLQTIDCLCMCSEKEAFGRVTIEGMLSECIVIGTNTGATDELIVDGVNGLKYEQGNSDDLAEKIEYCLNNQNEIIKIKEYAKKNALSKYTDVQNADAIQKIYRRELGVEIS